MHVLKEWKRVFAFRPSHILRSEEIHERVLVLVLDKNDISRSESDRFTLTAHTHMGAAHGPRPNLFLGDAVFERVLLASRPPGIALDLCNEKHRAVIRRHQHKRRPAAPLRGEHTPVLSGT